MQKIHDFLSSKFDWYARWHTNTGQTSLHFLVLLLMAFWAGSSLYNNIALLSEEEMLYATAISSFSITGENIPDLNDKAVKLLKAYSKVVGSDREAQIEALSNVLEKRKQKLIEKFSKGGVDLDSSLFPESFSAMFPDEVQGLLEKEVNISGVALVQIFDGVNDEDSWVEYTLDASDDYKLHFGLHKPNIKTGDEVSVKGVVLDREVWVSDNGTLGSVSVTSTSLASDVIGIKTLLVIPVSFANNTNQPWPVSYVEDWIFTNTLGLASLYTEGSFGKLAVTGAVTPWMQISASVGTTCDTGTWASKADQMAQSAGYNLSSYQHRMYVLNGVSTSICNWGGTAYVNGPQSWVNGTYAAYGTPAHELGHNLGAWHSGSLSCGSVQIAPLANCTFNNYGERNAKMGSANNAQFNIFGRNLFAWIPSSQVSTISSPGTYTIASDYSTSTAYPKILKIAKPNTGENYYIGFKQAQGFNASLTSGATKGVSVYLKPNSPYSGSTSGGASDSMLLMMQPNTDYTNAALWDGGTFTDTANNLTITQLSHTADTATVSISFVTLPCTTASPTVTVSPTSGTTAAGKSLSYNVSVKNNNSSTCPSANYNISATSIPSGWTFVGGTLNLASGATASKSVTITSNSTALDGSYPFGIVASDASDASKTANVSVSYIVYTDNVGPVVTITAPSSGATLATNTSINVNASDMSGVAKIEVYIDGVLFKTTTGVNTLSAKWNTRKVTTGPHTITARAYDTLGNMNSVSIIVSK